MNITPAELSVVAASAIAGCAATAVAFNAVTGKPVSTIAGNWRKHVWSIVFALPALIVFHLDLPLTFSLLILVVWLVLAPSIAAKYVFGPKDADWSFLLMLHAAYAFTTLACILIFSRALSLI
jgi:hypothetical protein